MTTSGTTPAPSALSGALAMAKAEVLEMVLSVRALFFLLVYLGAAAFAGVAMVKLDEGTEGQLSEMQTRLSQLGETEKAQAIEQLKNANMPEGFIEAFLDGRFPILLLAILYFSTFFLPGVILLVGFNRISGDVSSRFTRYLLQRVHRGSYLAGKVVGHFVVSFAAIVLVHAILLAIGKSQGVFGFDLIMAAMPRIWVSMALFTFTYVAYCQLFSALVSQPFLSLLFGLLGLFAIRFLTFALSFAWEPFDRFWLDAWDLPLWTLQPAAVAVYLGYGVGFVGLSWLVLRRKDL